MVIKIVVYCLIAWFATTVGALSGMGGGVIMKPVFDVMRHYSATEIAVLTSCTVFAMALVSVLLGAKTFREEKTNRKTIIFSALGSLGGGYAGQALFALATQNAADSTVKILQNAVLLALVAVIFVYMSRKGTPKTLGLSGVLPALITGLLLGAISSFLGIGGGPINVAVFVFVFGMGMKSAAICSLTSVVFAQAAKLVTMLATDGIAPFAIDILPYVVVAGVVGALLGKLISAKLNEKGTKIFYLCVQVLVVGLTAWNIIRYAI